MMNILNFWVLLKVFKVDKPQAQKDEKGSGTCGWCKIIGLVHQGFVSFEIDQNLLHMCTLQVARPCTIVARPCLIGSVPPFQVSIQARPCTNVARPCSFLMLIFTPLLCKVKAHKCSSQCGTSKTLRITLVLIQSNITHLISIPHILLGTFSCIPNSLPS